jgi:DNA-binding response OmpR family regulator
MIVDDEPSIGTMLEKALGRSKDFKIEYYDNPINALSRFRAGAYDGVLLDIMMPHKDGLSVLEEIKTKDPECVVIMMTAYSIKPPTKYLNYAIISAWKKEMQEH